MAAHATGRERDRWYAWRVDEDDVLIETSGPLFDRVDAALELVRPALREDGGDVRLVEVEDGSIAIVELQGQCVGCPMSEITVRHGIEAVLRAQVPAIIGVDVVTDESLPQRTFTEVLERASFTPLDTL